MEPNKNSMKWVWTAIVIVIVVIIIGVFTSQSSAKTVKIGFISPMSGQSAAYGEYARRAFEIGLDDWNSTHTYKMEAVYEDGKCAPADAATAANKLINIDKVNFIMTFCTGETNAVVPITESHKVILLTAGTTAPNITKGKYVFRNIGSVGSGLPKLTQMAYDFNKKIALISENTNYAISSKDAFKQQFTALGGTVVFDESFDSKSMDFRTIISKLKSAGISSVFVVVQALDNSGLLFKQMKELNYHPQIFSTEAAISDKSLEKYITEGYENIIEGAILITPYFDRTNSIAAHLLGVYQDKYQSTKGPIPEEYLATHYDAVFLLGDASMSVGTNSDSVRQYFLTKIKNWQGAIGSFSFDATGDAVTSVVAETVKGGKIVPLTK